MTIADNAEGVDIGGLAEEAALLRCASSFVKTMEDRPKGMAFCGVIFVDAVNEAGQCAAYSGFILIEGDLLLGEHKLFEAMFFDAVGDLVR